MSPKLLLRTASIAEAITWAMLLFGMLVKYGLGGTGLIVTIGGSLHGAVFVAYLFVGLLVGVNQRFSWWAFLLVFAASVPPFATLLFDWIAERRGLLEGPWRSGTRITFGAEVDEETLDDADIDSDEVEASPVGGASTPRSTVGGGAQPSTATAEPIRPALPAHPADVRVAERGERTPPVRWLDPLVRWCVTHPYTMGSVAVLVAALILTRALSAGAGA